MATWDDAMSPDIGNVSANTATLTLQGMSPDIGNVSANTATLTLQGMSPDIGNVSANTTTLTLQGMSPDIGNVSLLQVVFDVDEIELITVLPVSDYMFEPGIIAINEITISIVEDVVVHFVYTGIDTITISAASEPVINWTYIGTDTISIAPISVVVPEWVYDAPTEIEITTSPSIILFYGNKPYLVKAALQIDGVDYSGDLFGSLNISMSDGSSTTFSFNLYSPLIPSDFVGKEVKISYQAADETGLVVSTETLVIGVIREAGINVDKPTLIEISGYDYAGYHNELGQLYSGDVTSILTGAVGVTEAGAINTGKSPIFNVAYIEPAILAIIDVQDGTDYFVDALSGIIYIPVSSKLLTAPASLQFQYVDPFASFDEMAQYIANLKGWTITNDGFAVSDYTEPKKQPIISLSNESIIDILKKLYEVGGGKLDSSLYPIMRTYCDRTNYEESILRTFTESDIVFGSLQMNCSLFDVLTDQTVKSVQNTYSNVIVGDFEIKEENSGSIPVEYKFNFAYGAGTGGVTYTNARASAESAFSSLVPKLIEQIEISLDNTGEYSFSHSGGGIPFVSLTWIYYCYGFGCEVSYIKEEYIIPSQAGRWVEELDTVNNSLKLSLFVDPTITNWEPPLINEQTSVGSWFVQYPQVDWSFSVSTKSISYGEGVATTQVEVSGTQAVQKIDIKLEGDVYEQPFIETQTQGEDLCKAVLHNRKFIYNASADVPLHKAGELKLGEKAEILSRSKSVIGNLKNISYNIDTENGSGIVSIDIKGFGTGI